MLIFFLLCYSTYYATVMYKVMLSFHRNNHKPTNPNRTTVEELKVFPFLEDVILNLKAELAQDGVAKVDLLDWCIKKEAGQQHTRK